MNLEEKRRLANERRLNALKQWKKNRVVQNIKPRTHVKYDEEDVPHQEKNVKLFESDSEEEKFEDCFDSRPQFEGQNGLNLLEMSSGFSSRFKLDERFKEDPVENTTEENEELSKNLKILESVLGHQVSEKVTTENFVSRKKQLRFDPERSSVSTNSPKVQKKNEMKNKKCKEREKTPNVVEETIPKSTERYIEVSSNLKDILCSSSGDFSLTDRFSLPAKSQDYKKIDISTVDFSKKPTSQTIISKGQEKIQTAKHSKNSYFEARTKQDPFFLTDDDIRLKEGVEFFIRPKPLEEIREDWTESRNEVLGLFKRRKLNVQNVTKRHSFKKDKSKK